MDIEMKQTLSACLDGIFETIKIIFVRIKNDFKMRL